MRRLYLDQVKPLTFDQVAERKRRVEHERTKFYVNRFPGDVFIKDRSGLVTRIQPTLESRTFDPDIFFVCEQISCTPDVKKDYVHQARQTPLSMRQQTHKAVLVDWNGVPPISARYSVEAYGELSIRTMLENDGAVYLEDHDLVVMYGLTGEEMDRLHHPYSRAGYTHRSCSQVREDNPHIRRGDFTFNIRIVDNSDRFGSRWILIGGEPFCIVADKDTEVTDGIYVTYSKNATNGSGSKKLLTDRFDLEDGAKLPYYKLYESQQEALLAGKELLADEASARIRELESKAATAENNLRKVQQERENMEREAQIKRDRHEQDMEKLRRENEKLEKEHELFMQKQVGEILSVGRKNTTEIIKCVPVVISTLACAMALFRKKE